MQNIGPIPIIICFSIYWYVRLQFFNWYRLWWLTVYAQLIYYEVMRDFCYDTLVSQGTDGALVNHDAVRIALI